MEQFIKSVSMNVGIYFYEIREVEDHWALFYINDTPLPPLH